MLKILIKRDFPGLCRCVSVCSHVRLFATLWTIAHQAPLSMGFSRQEYRSGLPCPPPGDLPDPGIKPVSPASPTIVGKFFINSATWETLDYVDGPQVITRVLVREGAGGPSQKGRYDKGSRGEWLCVCVCVWERDRDRDKDLEVLCCWPRRWSKGPPAKECRWPSDVGKARTWIFPSSLWKEFSPADTSTLGLSASRIVRK